jgi:hypothetical protein
MQTLADTLIEAARVMRDLPRRGAGTHQSNASKRQLRADVMWAPYGPHAGFARASSARGGFHGACGDGIAIAE